MQHFYVFVARGFSDFLMPHLVRTRDLSLISLSLNFSLAEVGVMLPSTKGYQD